MTGLAWVVFSFSVLNVFVAVSGGKDLVHGDKAGAILKIVTAIILAAICSFGMYINGILYGLGDPLTLIKFLGIPVE